MTAAAETHRGPGARAARTAAARTEADAARPGPGDGPAAEAAVAYAQDLGWPLTPGYPAEAGRCGCGRPQCAELGSHPVPGAWRVAACSTPTLVRVVWRMCVGAPVLAVLGRPVPGVARLGAVSAPALIGVAALELLSKRSAAQGPVLDGFGRISFLVDLGPGEPADFPGPAGLSGLVGQDRDRDRDREHSYAGGRDCDGTAFDEDTRAADGFACWRRAGMDLAVLGTGTRRECVPLPTPGFVGPSGVVWALRPRPDGKVPPLAAVAEVFDRAVRSTYPSLWRTVHASPGY